MSSTSDVYMDEPWVLIRWDQEHRCVFADWKGFATSSEFQSGLTKALDVVKERQAVNLVSDTQKLESISDEDQRWIRYSWAPLAAASGLRRVAVVLAPSGLSKMAIQTMFKGRRRTGLQSRTFDSLTDALRWVGEA
jgi:stage II sporulation SpoAA-like protein